MRWFNPPDPEYALNQNYYLHGFKKYLGKESVGSYPSRANIPASFIDMDMSRYGVYANMQVNRLLGLLPEAPSEEARLAHERHQTFVGQYMLRDDAGRTVKFAIDAQDASWVFSPKILDWCDVYFKSNRWARLTYPEKVLPIVNGCPQMAAGHGKRIDKLKSLRNCDKQWDLVFVTRVYPSSPTHGMKHNAQLFEALAGLDCKKYLMAILTRETAIENPELSRAVEDRLTQLGVEVVHRKLMPIDQLFELQAKSRLVVLRSGPLRCIPWRMVELLCMGACIVCDATPEPEWPVPLREGENFVNLGIRRPEDADEGPMEDYQRVPQIVRQALENQDLQSRIRANNSRYFDDHASPERVAEYALSKLVERSSLSAPDNHPTP